MNVASVTVEHALARVVVTDRGLSVEVVTSDVDIVNAGVKTLFFTRPAAAALHEALGVLLGRESP